MSLAKDPTLRELNDCNCCTGIGACTPLEVKNRPGLTAVAYRIGNHALFKESMLARLSSSDLPRLRELRIRDDDDFIIAYLDAWATVADILTFYQERIANESYLRTATEDVSLYRLARLIGYRPRPGVAASTHLAFTVEDADGAPAQTPIAIGTRVQSIPGPGQKPQVFETIEAIEARPEWNNLKPRMTHDQTLSTLMDYAEFTGLGTNLKVGDRILIVEDENANNWEVKRVIAARTDTDEKTTRAEFESEAIETLPFVFPILSSGVFFTTPLNLTTSLVGSQLMSASWKQADLSALARIQRWPMVSLSRNLKFQLAQRELAKQIGIFALNQQAAIFGHNLPKWSSLTTEQQSKETNWDQPARTLSDQSGGAPYVYLDRTYSGLVPGSWVVLENPLKSPTQRKIYQIQEITELSRNAFTLSAKVTRLTLDSSDGFSEFTVRGTSVLLAASEPFELADLPITDDVPLSDGNNSVVLDQPELRLQIGQMMILTGERSDLEGVVESELVTIADVTISGGYTKLTFQKALKHHYIRKTVSMNANVALATHGERREEPIGSGDGKTAFQKLPLPQPPLTYIAANNPGGASAAIEVRVDGIKWQEAASLFGKGPAERVYVIRTDYDGETTLHFGDGNTGARLPTGLENVTAVYRKGMGEDGMVDSGQLSLLMTRPLGVSSVTNPMSAAGAENRETRDQLQQNAPLTVLTLDRIVSLQDYEDYAKSFAGIAKALVTWTWDGQRRGIFVTVAGPKGAAVAGDSQTCKNLLDSMKQAGDPLVPIRVQSYTPAFFLLAARIKIHPDHQDETVLAEVREALRQGFSFEAREFGQAVTRSEVYATIQKVAGVLAVDIDYLYRSDENEPTLQPALSAAEPQAGAEFPRAAELLTLDPRPIQIGIMT
jgi:hypothetical protein